MIFRIADDGDADAETCRGGALRHGLGGVVGSFGMNIRAQRFEKGFHVGFVEENNVVDGTESCDELRTGLLIEDRAARPLECANAAIRIDSDDEDIALAASSFQIAYVPDVERVEAAVSKNDALTAELAIGKYGAELVARDDFGFGAAHDSRRGAHSVAAERVEEFLTGDSRRAALHHDQTARDIGDVSRFERRGAAGKREGVGSEDRVTRTGDVDGLIASVDGNSRVAIAGFEKRHAVAAASDEERIEFHCRKRRTAAANQFVEILAN